MKRYKKQLYIVGIFWILFFQNIIGQSSYIFHHLDTKDGLSNNTVKAFLRDSYGFLWIGTEAGLNKYDGYGFNVYTTRFGAPKTLITNDIMDLQEDGLGNIWVYFGYTYMVYDRDKDCFDPDFKQILLDLGMQSEADSKVFVDKKRNIWVFNNRKVFHYNIQKKTKSAFNLKIPFTENITTNITDNGDYLYTVLKSGVCWQMNKNTGAQILYKLPDFIIPEIANGRNRIYADSNNGLWFSSSLSDQILYKKSTSQQWEIINLISEIKSVSNVITSIIENQTGQIWIATDHKGIFVYDRVLNTISNIVYKPSTYTSLSSNSVQFLYRDNNETIWVGHNKKGLSFYHESFRNFINFQHPECSDITKIIEDHLGNIWLGTDGNGVYVKDQHSDGNIKKLPIPNTAIVSMIEDRKGRIWIGTYMKGLYCYDKGKIVQYTTKNSKLSSNDIWGLKEDRYGNIWIGALGGKTQVLKSDANDFQSIVSPFNTKDYALDMFYDGG
ncbi:MAG TPA: two-component regulator propeller domain-containing protein, partial [Paludibacter sp.]|nr:two-component regulator propeller domain-containing protein [Paludibacter sp.]